MRKKNKENKGKCRSWGQTINLQSTIIRKEGEERINGLFLFLFFILGCCFCCLLVVLLYCGFAVLFWLFGEQQEPKKKQHQKNKTFLESFFVSICGFGVVVCFDVFLFCLILVFVLIVVVVVVLLFRLVWGTPTKESTQQQKTTTPLTTPPCFITFFALLCLEAVCHRKANSPRAKKNRCFSSLFSRKRFFPQKEAFGFRGVVVFFVVSFFFVLRLNSWPNFEGQFGVHKMARQQFKLISRVWNFDQFKHLKWEFVQKYYKIRGFKQNKGSKLMSQKWPIWKPVRGPQGGRFGDHIHVSFSDLHSGPLIGC